MTWDEVKVRESDAWESLDGVLRIGTRDEDGFHPAHEGDIFDLVAALRAEVARLTAMCHAEIDARIEAQRPMTVGEDG